MIEADEAWGLVRSHAPTIRKKNQIAIEQLFGQHLAESISADRPSPPFNRVAMDGIALSFDTLARGDFSQRLFKENLARAGVKQIALENFQNCIEVMTGSILPKNCDTVIRYEDLEQSECGKYLQVDTSARSSIAKGKNIHQTGIDHPAGKPILESGEKVNAAKIAVLASEGKSEVLVWSKTKVAVVSTGDELVSIDHSPEDYQIRISNSYAIKAELERLANVSVELFHLPDDPVTLASQLSEILDSVDYLILSGGVSAGKFDFVPQVLADIGVKKIFHKVKQRPGKPLYFGTLGDKMVFGLPGNPVSALVNARVYIVGALRRNLGNTDSELQNSFLVRLGEEIKTKSDFTFFIPARIENHGGLLKAYRCHLNGSGDFYNLICSDGLVKIHRDKGPNQDGEIATFFPWGGFHV